MTEARHCPTCGTLGILPLNQPHDERGRIVDPLMVCPVCRVEFRATGVTWLGASRPPVEGSEEELEAWAQAFVEVLLGPETDDVIDAE